MLSNLPLELLTHISNYLLPKDLLSLSTVCKRLHTWSSDPSLWLAALILYSRHHPDQILDAEADFLRDIPDLKLFYTQIIERYKYSCGLYRSYKTDSLLQVRMDLAMLGIVGKQIQFRYNRFGGTKESLQFIIPIDIETYSCDLEHAEFTELSNEHEQSIASVVFEDNGILVKCNTSTSSSNSSTASSTSSSTASSTTSPSSLNIVRRLRLDNMFLRSNSEWRWVRFDPLMTCSYPAIQSGFFRCDALERIMLLQSDSQGIFICTPDATSSHFKVSTNKVVDFEGVLQLLFDSQDIRLTHDMIDHFCYDNVFYNKINPVGRKDLSKFKTDFERRGLKPSCVGLTDDYTCLEVYSCTWLSSDVRVVQGRVLCVITCSDKLTILMDRVTSGGNFHFTRIPGIVSKFEIVE